MKPIRGEREREVIHDPWHGGEKSIGQNDTTHVLSDDGAIESLRTGRRMACACGCLKPPGGYCGRCVQPVCVDCFGFCLGCHMPMCPRHSVFVDSESGATLRFCKHCHEKASRRKLARDVVRTILSPFIRFGDGHAQE